MGYGFCLQLWGDYACFTRPEMKVERVSYDVITPSAARGILESIYWKPAIKWIIDKIHVINPIKFTSIVRNEVSEKISIKNVQKIVNGKNDYLYLDTSQYRQLRSSLILKNVNYCIEVHFEMTENAGERDDEKKHYNIALRKIKNGQFFHQPYFGTREFTAHYKLLDKPLKSKLKGEVDLGYMLYDMDFKCSNEEGVNYNEAEPIFYRPIMIDGVIDVNKYYRGLNLK